MSCAPCLNLCSWTQHSHKALRPVSAVWTPDSVAWLWQRSASLQSPGVSPRKLCALESCRTAGRFGCVAVTFCGSRMAAHQLVCVLQLHQIIYFLFFWQQKVEFDPTSSYAVEGLKPDTLYKFRLGARSELGVGVYTPTVEARTAQSSKCLMFNTAGDKAKVVHFPSPGPREAQCLCTCGFAGMPACSLLKGVMGKVSWGLDRGSFAEWVHPRGKLFLCVPLIILSFPKGRFIKTDGGVKQAGKLLWRD